LNAPRADGVVVLVIFKKIFLAAEAYNGLAAGAASLAVVFNNVAV
jgi:hypothetical protein